VTKYGILGDDDIGRDFMHYQTTVQCKSQAEVYRLSKEEFIHFFKHNKIHWRELMRGFE
jgi:hypothetical protein